jgi:protease-4
MARKGTFLAITALAVVLVIGLTALGLVLYFTMEAPVEEKTFLHLAMNGEYPEEPLNDPFAKLAGVEVVTVHDVLVGLQKAADDERIEGVILELQFPSLGFAKVQEIRSAVEAYRAKTGKPVYAYGELYFPGTYYLALSASEVHLMPVGEVFIPGIRAETPFFRGTLDWLRIKPQLFQIREYKNAADIFMREDMSEAHREAETALIGDIYQGMVQAVAKRWSWDEQKAVDLIDIGVFTAEEAKEAGLVTHLSYWDQFEEHVLKAAGLDPEEDELNTIELAKYVRHYKPKGKEKIAIVVAEGEINQGSSGDGLMGRSMGSDTVAGALREIREDGSYKGVLLRVDSPGGSAIASDVIWRETRKLKEAGIPVVVSMGNVAASGGYYISCGADAIVAQPGTITGSIGVVTGKFNTDGFWRERVKTNWAGIQFGKNADIFSSSTDFTPEQAELVVRQMEAIYDTFISHVAEGRGKTKEEIDAVGKGRVWTGNQALQHGLVDALGGYEEALAILRKKANLSDDAALRYDMYPRAKSFFETVFQTRSARSFRLEDLDHLERHISFLREPIQVYAPLPVIK